MDFDNATTEPQEPPRSATRRRRVPSPDNRPTPLNHQFASDLYRRVFGHVPVTLGQSYDVGSQLSQLRVSELSLHNTRTLRASRVEIFTPRRSRSVAQALNDLEENIQQATETLLSDSDGTLLLLPLRSSDEDANQAIYAAGPYGVLVVHSIVSLYNARLPFTPGLTTVSVELPKAPNSDVDHVFRFPRSEANSIPVVCRAATSAHESFTAIVYASSLALRVVSFELRSPSMDAGSEQHLQGRLTNVDGIASIVPTPNLPKTENRESSSLRWCKREAELGATTSTTDESETLDKTTCRKALASTDLTLPLANEPTGLSEEATARLPRDAIQRLLDEHR